MRRTVRRWNGARDAPCRGSACVAKSFAQVLHHYSTTAQTRDLLPRGIQRDRERGWAVARPGRACHRAATNQGSPRPEVRWRASWDRSDQSCAREGRAGASSGRSSGMWRPWLRVTMRALRWGRRASQASTSCCMESRGTACRRAAGRLKVGAAASDRGRRVSGGGRERRGLRRCRCRGGGGPCRVWRAGRVGRVGGRGGGVVGLCVHGGPAAFLVAPHDEG